MSHSRYMIKPIDFAPPPEAKADAYGLSIKWWPSGEFYKFPRIHESPTSKRHREFKFTSNRIIVAWLKMTMVFYWPTGVFVDAKAMAETRQKETAI